MSGLWSDDSWEPMSMPLGDATISRDLVVEAGVFQNDRHGVPPGTPFVAFRFRAVDGTVHPPFVLLLDPNDGGLADGMAQQMGQSVRVAQAASRQRQAPPQ